MWLLHARIDAGCNEGNDDRSEICLELSLPRETVNETPRNLRDGINLDEQRRLKSGFLPERIRAIFNTSPGIFWNTLCENKSEQHRTRVQGLTNKVIRKDTDHTLEDRG